MDDQHRIAAAGVAATIKADGAELCGLQDATGQEWLWGAGPAWPRHAPVLFPIVGRLAGDTLRHAGHAYGLTQHGFARDRRFEWVHREADMCRLRLVEDATTLASYPFRFSFELAYRVDGASLTQEFVLGNPGEVALPASLGAHPAFRWPLPQAAGAPHRILFEAEEPAPIRRLEGGLLKPVGEPSPVSGRVLALRPDLFAADAIVMPSPASRRLRYEAVGGPALEVSWDGFPQLGLWCKPGAGFLCIEPWHGFASPLGWDGEFMHKPGILVVPPGEERRFSLRLTLA